MATDHTLLIVSVPKEKQDEFGCPFYRASESECRRVDKWGLSQAFFEGFPCWHRGAFLLLENYAWTGNFRELNNFVLKLAIELCDAQIITRTEVMELLAGKKITQSDREAGDETTQRMSFTDIEQVNEFVRQTENKLKQMKKQFQDLAKIKDSFQTEKIPIGF